MRSAEPQSRNKASEEREPKRESEPVREDRPRTERPRNEKPRAAEPRDQEPALVDEGWNGPVPSFLGQGFGG